jgi:hypothetical protein
MHLAFTHEQGNYYLPAVALFCEIILLDGRIQRRRHKHAGMHGMHDMHPKP